MKHFIALLLFGLFFFQFSYAQYPIPKKPELQTSVYDYINLLSKSQKKTLEEKLIRYSDSTSTQIVITIISSTEGENIAYLAANWGEKWGIGQEKEDNGILILLAKDDRKITISTGKGVEFKLTDLLSRRIIENRILPEFRRNDYYKGLDEGIEEIFKVLTGEFKETNKKPREKKSSGSGWVFIFIIAVILLIIFFRGRGGGGNSWRRRSTSDTILNAIILSSLGRGSFGGSSSSGSSGSGFGGGFGGGSFGGGGATGSW